MHQVAQDKAKSGRARIGSKRYACQICLACRWVRVPCVAAATGCLCYRGYNKPVASSAVTTTLDEQAAHGVWEFRIDLRQAFDVLKVM